MATYPCLICGSTERDNPAKVPSKYATRCCSCDNIIEPSEEEVWLRAEAEGDPLPVAPNADPAPVVNDALPAAETDGPALEE